MAAGAKAIGQPAALRPSTSYRGRPDHDVAIFYGLAGGLRKVFEDYRKHHRALYIDLGYWGRRKRTRYDGHHKIVLNNRHPTAYFQRTEHAPDRFNAHKVKILPWREPTATGHILVVGMSAKAATAEGLAPEAWERKTIAALRKLTDRPIRYRAKPNWLDAKPIPGSIWDGGGHLAESFRDCHAVVAHHSNVAVDALLAGIPCICRGGVASVLSGHHLSQIETPPMPDGREQWAADLSYTQWSIDEMRDGRAWHYLIREGLI